MTIGCSPTWCPIWSASPKLATGQYGQSLDDLGIVVYDVCLSHLIANVSWVCNVGNASCAWQKQVKEGMGGRCWRGKFNYAMCTNWHSCCIVILLLYALLCGSVTTLACSAQTEDCCKFLVACPQVAAHNIILLYAVTVTAWVSRPWDAWTIFAHVLGLPSITKAAWWQQS